MIMMVKIGMISNCLMKRVRKGDYFGGKLSPSRAGWFVITRLFRFISDLDTIIIIGFGFWKTTRCADDFC
jgi:hypothetical protein